MMSINTKNLIEDDFEAAEAKLAEVKKYLSSDGTSYFIDIENGQLVEIEKSTEINCVFIWSAVWFKNIGFCKTLVSKSQQWKSYISGLFNPTLYSSNK